MAPMTWLDRAIGAVSPGWQVRRLRSRLMAEVAQRHYEGAATGRRTQGWRKSTADANAVIGPALSSLRASARDLVRNNPYAESALSTIVDHAVGWGIEAKPYPRNDRTLEAWKAWADTTACDAEGRHNFAGLQKLIMRTVVESGEVLVRRRLRRPTDGLPIPLQLQVLDPDFLDTSKDTATGLAASGGGNRIIQGVEFNALGQTVAYWLYREHPGAASGSMPESVRVPAESVLHIFRPLRPGQVRGPSWFAPVLLRFKDFDEYEDATLMKQKIAACLSVLTTDPSGAGTSIGEVDATGTLPIDALEPGMILNMQPGRSIEVVNPPRVDDYDIYSKTVLRAIATGLGVTYEDLTGDYQGMPFSAARMSRLRHWARVEDWRWRIVIPQFCDPVWRWAMQAAAMAGVAPAQAPQARWSAPPPPMVDPAAEGLALQRLIRIGVESWSNVVRERGYDPDEVLDEIASDNAKFDALGITLDSDPRRMTQAGQGQPDADPADDVDDAASGTATAPQPSRDPDEDDDARGARLRLARRSS